MTGKDVKIIFGILLAIIAFQLIFELFPIIMTGLTSLSLSILPEEKICIDYFDVPEKVNRFDRITIKGVLWNCGSIKISPTARISMLRGSEEISFDTIIPPLIQAGEKTFFRYEWSANPRPGNYTARLKASPNSMVTWVEKNKTLLIVDTTDDVTSTDDPSIQFLPTDMIFAEEYNLTVEYPRHINLTQDSEYTILIKATNVGNLPIHNISMNMISKDFELTLLNPEIIDTLDPDSSIIFILRATVPVNLDPEFYKIRWDIKSNEIKRSGLINVQILELSEKELAEQMIEYYSNMIEVVQDEINDIREIKNVTEAERIVSEANQELNVAKDLYRVGLYKRTLEQLEIVREKIENAVISTSKAKVFEKELEIKIVRAEPRIECLIWLVLTLTIISLLAVLLTFKTKLDWKIIVGVVAFTGLVMMWISNFVCWIIILIALLLVIAIYIFLKPWKKRFEFIRIKKW